MFPDWFMLPADQQLALSHAALRTAAETIASQAEMLATEIELGALADHGGPDALRLLAALVRLAGPTCPVTHMEPLAVRDSMEPIASMVAMGHA